MDWHSALCQVFLCMAFASLVFFVWLLCLKFFFAWSVSFFCSETSSRTALTNCGATLIAEDHPVPVLTQHVNCRQLQSSKEYDSPPQRNRHHDHHCCRLNPLAPTAHKVVLVLWSQAGLPGSRGFQSFGPDLAHHRQTTHLLLQRKNQKSFSANQYYSPSCGISGQKRFGASWILQMEWTGVFLLAVNFCEIKRISVLSFCAITFIKYVTSEH